MALGQLLLSASLFPLKILSFGFCCTELFLLPHFRKHTFVVYLLSFAPSCRFCSRHRPLPTVLAHFLNARLLSVPGWQSPGLHLPGWLPSMASTSSPFPPVDLSAPIWSGESGLNGLVLHPQAKQCLSLTKGLPVPVTLIPLKPPRTENTNFQFKFPFVVLTIQEV